MAVFLMVFILLFAGVSYFLQPVWTDWNNYSRTTSFYEQPDDTLEVIFLGPSDIINSITPSELYESYGICAYNLASEDQPLLAAYYWLEETYRLHSDTLTTVVLDAYELFTDPEEYAYHKALDGMEWSSVKIRAAWDYTDCDLRETLTFLVPMFSYHDRWTDLDQSDFEKAGYVSRTGTRGYHLSTTRYLDNAGWSSVPVQDGLLDETAQPTEIDGENIAVLNRLIDFCEEHGLQLVLMKSPRYTWSSANHNAVQQIAEDNQLVFLDFNFDPLMEELDVNFALDMESASHANYYGAQKLTEWMGQWLTENADVTDNRENARYDFMEEELEGYYELVIDTVRLEEATDPAEYLETAMGNEDNEVFLLVRGSAADCMTDEMRAEFQSLGLTTLSELTSGSAYIGVIEGGSVVYEETNAFDQDAYAAAAAAAALPEAEEAETLLEPFSSITYSGVTGGGLQVVLESGGTNSGDIASCRIDGTEYAANTRGLNIVVYNRAQKEVTDSAVFDLQTSSARTALNLAGELTAAEAEGTAAESMPAILQSLVLYNQRAERIRTASAIDQTAGEDGLLEYLQAYMERDNAALFLSVKGEAAESLSSEARELLAGMGLTVLAGIEYGDSYIGVIENGEVIYEASDHGQEPIAYSGISWSVTSAGLESGDASSVIINGTQYAPSTRGINIVVYDMEQAVVIDTSVFDTGSTAVRLPESE